MMKKYLFNIDNESYNVEIQEISNGRATIVVNGEVVHVAMQQDDILNTIPVEPAKSDPVVTTPTQASVAETPVVKKEIPKANAAGKAQVKAPLPGIVRNINVRIGDKVKFGDTVLMLEAMKMENNINATETGTIIDILCTNGEAVKEGDTLIVIGE